LVFEGENGHGEWIANEMEWNGRIYNMKQKKKMFGVWVFSRGVASIYKHNAYLIAFGSITH